MEPIWGHHLTNNVLSYLNSLINCDLK